MQPDERERLARLEARLDAAIEDRDEMRSAIREMRTEVREIRDTIVAARGGWRTIAAVGGFCLAVGALVDRTLGWIGWVR